MTTTARHGVATLLMTVLALIAAVLVPVGARAAAPTPAASVQIATTGQIGRFDTAIVTVRERCRAGTIFAELVVDAHQDGVSGTRAGTFGGRCDGGWHALTVEVFSDTGDEFVPGPVQSSARLTVLAADSMDPLPQATDTAQVQLQPRVSVRIVQGERVGRFGSAVVALQYRCQRPWLVAELGLNVTQGSVSGSTFRDTGLSCDGRWHRIEVGVGSDTGDPFVAGFANVTASVRIEDPDSFDPFDSSTARATPWFSPAARIIVDGAQRRANGTVRVTVSARCQRPWVVAEYVVEVDQVRTGGLTAATTGLVCDSLWHRLTLTVTGNTRFAAGPATVRTGLDVLDPVDFDPVDQATDTRAVLLH